MLPNSPDILKNLLGINGQGNDVMRENGSVTFAQADEGDIYYNGAAVADMPLQTAAAAIELVSNSGNDDVAGTGALTVKVGGLDGNYAWVTEILTLTGAVAVVGTQLFMRVLDLQVMTCGTGLTNAGQIACQAVGGGQVWDVIVVGEGRNQHSLITVPAKKRLWITRWVLSCSALVAQEYRVMFRAGNLKPWIVGAKRYAYFGGVVGEDVPLAMTTGFPSQSDIKIRAILGGGGKVSSHMAGFLTDVINSAP